MGNLLWQTKDHCILSLKPAHMHAYMHTVSYYAVADVAVLKCVLQATDGFLFVAQCENGCIIYVSDSVTPVLSFTQVSSTSIALQTWSQPFSSYKQGSHASLKVLEFFSPKFKALKVLEKRTGAWKSLNFITQVLESPWIYHVVKHCDHQIH